MSVQSCPTALVSCATDSSQSLVPASPGLGFHFVPPAGGDTRISSCEGTIFLVHSSVLASSSSVFADMFSVGTKSEDVIILTDDTESLSLMLTAIYKPDLLAIRDFTSLEKILRIGEKYDAECISHTLDNTIPLEQHGTFLQDDPAQTLQICASYRLNNVTSIAIKAVQRQTKYFQDQDAIVDLVNRLPGNAMVLKLAGIAASRTRILHDTLYDFQSGLPPQDSGEEIDPDVFSRLLCTTCYKTLSYSRRYPDLNFRPHWLFDWARIAFNELVTKDIDDCNGLFQAGVLGRVVKNTDHPFCIREIRSNGSTFDYWARNVQNKLRREFSELYSSHGL